MLKHLLHCTLLSALCTLSYGASSISQFGITWKFDRDYPTGQFANGDYWVVGPVTITQISPADPNPNDGTDLHGTMINPMPQLGTPRQSWDSRIGDRVVYDRDENVARRLPLRVDPSSSVVSVRSLPNKDKNRQWIGDAAVLTVLAKAPPQGSFRPPYAGDDKSIVGTVSQLDLSVFRNLSAPKNAPRLSSYASRLQQPLLDIIGQWPNSSVKNSNGGPSYGRDISYEVGDLALSLNLNHPASQKLPLIIRLVQRGIDTYGLAKAGMVWSPNGGHNSGRKLPMIIAARALNHPGMLEWSDARRHMIFQEDMQHFYVTEEDIRTPRKLSSLLNYTRQMLGMAEWGSNPISERDQTGSEWDKPYRTANGTANVSVVLAAEIMGLRRQWNWDPIFDYIRNRYVPAEKGSLSKFHRAMWESFSGQPQGGNGAGSPGAGPVTPPDDDFDEGTVGTDDWQSIGLPGQRKKFIITFNTVASNRQTRAVTGLSNGPADAESDLAVAVRFSPSGTFEAIDGSSFRAANRVSFSAGVTYQVAMSIDLDRKKYSVMVTAPNSAPVVIAEDWSFRREQSRTALLDSISFLATSHSHAVLNPEIVPNG